MAGQPVARFRIASVPRVFDKSAGLTGRDIAVVLRVSPQRVSQLLGGHRITSTGSRIAGQAKQRIHAHR
jgi:hypothetical protein